MAGLLSARTHDIDSTWETLFFEWAKPLGKTEQARCENAESVIHNAVKNSDALKNRSITVFTQGSYRNRVNIRQDSDVDVGVLCDDSFFYDLPTGETPNMRGFSTPAEYTFVQFKNELEDALVSYLGRSAVVRGKKAFDVHETSYHVEADVVPLFEYRYYLPKSGFIAGVGLLPDGGGPRIHNYPEKALDHWPDIPLHYENGVSKNTATSRRFKKVVRIVKKLRNFMEDNGYTEAKPIPGYLIECLAWNVANTSYSGTTWLPVVRSVLCSIWSATKEDLGCDEWTEVDNIKYLFRPSQPWTRQQAHDFVSKAWELIGIS